MILLGVWRFTDLFSGHDARGLDLDNSYWWTGLDDHYRRDHLGNDEPNHNLPFVHTTRMARIANCACIHRFHRLRCRSSLISSGRLSKGLTLSFRAMLTLHY